MLGNLCYAIFQDPVWSAAIAAWLLFVVTALAAIFGVPAAIAAAKTFQLESDPIIVIREKPGEEPVPQNAATFLSPVFVVTGMPTIPDGITLREESRSDRSNPNFASSLNKPVMIILHNAGRAPALAVRVPFTVTALAHLNFPERDPNAILSDAVWEKGSGAVTLPGIGPNESVAIMFQNLLGGPVTLKAENFGTYTRIEGRKHIERDLVIVALREIMLLAA